MGGGPGLLRCGARQHEPYPDQSPQGTGCTLMGVHGDLCEFTLRHRRAFSPTTCPPSSPLQTCPRTVGLLVGWIPLALLAPAPFPSALLHRSPPGAALRASLCQLARVGQDHHAAASADWPTPIPYASRLSSTPLRLPPESVDHVCVFPSLSSAHFPHASPYPWYVPHACRALPLPRFLAHSRALSCPPPFRVDLLILRSP